MAIPFASNEMEETLQQGPFGRKLPLASAHQAAHEQARVGQEVLVVNIALATQTSSWIFTAAAKMMEHGRSLQHRPVDNCPTAFSTPCVEACTFLIHVSRVLYAWVSDGAAWHVSLMFPGSWMMDSFRLLTGRKKLAKLRSVRAKTPRCAISWAAMVGRLLCRRTPFDPS